MTAFEIRILPWFGTDNLLQAKGINSLSKPNKRKLNFLAHSKFRQRLIQHCGDASHPHNRIVWVTEEYTSKLCGRCHAYCGYIGISRTLKCPNEACGQHVGRDANATRNIGCWGVMGALKRVEKAKMTNEVRGLRFRVGWLCCVFLLSISIVCLLVYWWGGWRLNLAYMLQTHVENQCNTCLCFCR